MARRKTTKKLPKLNIADYGLSVKYRGLNVVDCRVSRGGRFEVRVDVLGDLITQDVPLSGLEFYAHGERLKAEEIVEMISAN